MAVDSKVVRAAIYPPMGVARVGPSPEYFLAPECIEEKSLDVGSYRDSQGALKRQAVRFRVYGYNAAGEVVRELHFPEADVAWTVHVANAKAAWYQWTMALDVAEAKGSKIPRRNQTVTGSDRRELVIDGGPRTIQGQSSDVASIKGKFQATEVELAEIRTDKAGRLIFLAARGKSASPTNQPIFPEGPNPFANADGWYDDICDGPVSATVRLEGQEIPVQSAWVITAPPNYGPALLGVRTLYDALFDVYVEAGQLRPPAQVSFRQHVYPILRRLSDLQWVNQGFAVQFGHGGPHDFGNPRLLAKLAAGPVQGVDLHAELRRQIFNYFRNPEGVDNNAAPWPWIYGDAMDIPAANTPRQNASVSKVQYGILRAWASGEFVRDWDETVARTVSLEEIPVSEQPDMLTRAALDYCLADAFHPGCEVTWTVRHRSLYSSPFRIQLGEAIQDYGEELTEVIALSETGPLHAQGPGGLTRWMGLPWQADTAFCRSGYDRNYDPYLPTFWPARVPNQVLTKNMYDVVVDPDKPREQRQAAFANRMNWFLPLKVGDTGAQMAKMVTLYGDMGLVEAMPGVADDPDFPEVMQVASFGPEVQDATVEGLVPMAASFAAELEDEQGPMPLPVTRPD